MACKIIEGDCLLKMAEMDAESIDAIVTDPPYGLSFMGKEWDHGVPGEPFWREALRVAKPGAHLLAFGGSRTYHRLACAIEDAGWEIRDQIMWLYGTGFPKSLNVGLALDKVAGVGSVDSGPHPNARKTLGNIQICKKDGSGRLLTPASEAGQRWHGWGTALKPAHEPIVLARKPLIGTVAANVLQHGTGALNIDATRIPGVKPDTTRGAGGQHGRLGPLGAQGRIEDDGKGRWPANLALDEEAAAMLDEQTGTLRAGVAVRHKSGGKNCHSERSKPPMADLGYPGSGGASRFFYCSKASKKERGADNKHPTVKPLALMRWLLRLVTPPGGTVLDPFAGSGSTLIAAVDEGIACIGIEMNPEYVEIAIERLLKSQPALFIT